MQGSGCAGAPGNMHQPQASSAPAGAQLGGLDLMAILQNAGVRPIPQPQAHPVKQEPLSSIQVSLLLRLIFRSVACPVCVPVWCVPGFARSASIGS